MSKVRKVDVGPGYEIKVSVACVVQSIKLYEDDRTDAHHEKVDLLEELSPLLTRSEWDGGGLVPIVPSLNAKIADSKVISDQDIVAVVRMLGKHRDILAGYRNQEHTDRFAYGDIRSLRLQLEFGGNWALSLVAYAIIQMWEEDKTDQ